VQEAALTLKDGKRTEERERQYPGLNTSMRRTAIARGDSRPHSSQMVGLSAV
jgi:hypothetical protein